MVIVQIKTVILMKQPQVGEEESQASVC